MPLNASESLKVATELKRDGNLSAAIKALEISYEKIKASQTSYGVETFLRLPCYLQAAGRSDEAWGCLNRLLIEGYPNQLESDQFKAHDRSSIYSSMSNFLHNERRHHQAIVFGSLSLMAWAEFHYLQAKGYNKPCESLLRKEAQEQFVRCSQPTELEERLRRSIPKKSGKFDLSKIVDYICETLKKPDLIKYDISFVEIECILHEHNKKMD